MKAAVYYKYGPPEVVQFAELPKPVPKEQEVLVKVHASTVNRTDSGFRSAEYVISRFWSGLLRPRNPVLGSEFAGVVEEVGNQVKRFKPGDHVFGFDDQSFGGHAEFLTIREDLGIVHMPSGTGFHEAAAIAEGAHYALCDIRAAKVQFGQHALVYGATGAIGSAAVQLLKYMGVSVTAVCGTAYLDLVKSLGAGKVLDYQNEDFTKTDENYHFIFDAVGKSSFGACKPLLTERGIYVSTELGKRAENIWLAMITPLYSKKKVIFPIPKTNQKDLEFLKQLVEDGKFKPVIDRVYPLDRIVEAYKYVETGQKIGNVILEI